MTPAVTLVLGALAGQERATPPLLASVALIALGTGAATLLEAGAPSWSALGAALFVGSSLTEAARVVGTQRLMAVHHFGSLEALLYTSLPAGALLIGASFAAEGTWPLVAKAGAAAAAARSGGGGLAAAAAAAIAALPAGRALALAAALSFAVNLTSFWAIWAGGPLTFKVAGCLKNLAVIWYAVAATRERVSMGQVLGYLASVAGFLIYTLAKARPAAAAARSGGGGAKAKAA